MSEPPEPQLLAARREIERLRGELAQAQLQQTSVAPGEAQRARHARRVKSEFLADLSHELHTPLNAIIGFAELILDGLVTPDSPQYRESLADIRAGGRRLLQLINDVLDLSRIEAGALELQPQRIDLGRMLLETLATLETAMAARRIRVETVVESLTETILDPVRLKQMLYHLISHALKAAPSGGRVAVRILAAADPDQLRVEVEGGMALNAAASEEAWNEASPGLGLALIRALAEVQGGGVGVRGAAGESSVLYFLLPRQPVPRAQA